MCMSDEKLALINAIINDDNIFEEIAEFLNNLSQEVSPEETPEDGEEVEEDDPAPFHMTASKPVYGWD